MGRKAKILQLSTPEREALEKGYKNASSGIFSRRCHIILLKSSHHTSKQIGSILGMTDQAVNNWVKRYESEGLSGLITKHGQGRSSILDKDTEAAKVKEVVHKERQRLKNAKVILEQELNKEFSMSTLKRFLKNLTEDGSESG